MCCIHILGLSYAQLINFLSDTKCMLETNSYIPVCVMYDYVGISYYSNRPRSQDSLQHAGISLLQYRSSFQSSTLIGRAVTRSQTSLGVRARFRLGFRAGYDVF